MVNDFSKEIIFMEFGILNFDNKERGTMLSEINWLAVASGIVLYCNTIIAFKVVDSIGKRGQFIGIFN